MKKIATNPIPSARKGLFTPVLATGLALFVGLSAPSMGSVFSDNFATGIDNWTLGGTSSLTWDQDSEKFGNSMSFVASGTANNTTFSRITAMMPTQTLAVGDVLSVTVTYHGLQYMGSNNSWFALGFVNNATDFEGFVGGVRADSRLETGGLNNFYAITGPSTKIGSGDGGNEALAGKELVSGTVFNFNGAYDGEGGSTGNIDDIMQVTFSMAPQVGDQLLISTTYLNLNTSASYTSQALVDSTMNTFEQILIGYQRRGGATVAPAFEIGSVNVNAIPEPGFYAAMLGLATGLVIVLKRRRS